MPTLPFGKGGDATYRVRLSPSGTNSLDMHCDDVHWLVRYMAAELSCGGIDDTVMPGLWAILNLAAAVRPSLIRFRMLPANLTFL